MNRAYQVRSSRTSREVLWEPEGEEGTLSLWLRCDHPIVVSVQEDAHGNKEEEDFVWVSIMTQVTGIEAGSAISITERWEIVADSVVEIFPQPCILRLEEDDWCGSLLVRFRARHTVHQGKEGALTISPEIRSPQILKLRFQNGTSWNL